jgi:D-tyrosyl-tRNA(Tyr) deacylase
LRHSADDLGLQHLLVPQFTLFGDVAKGHRPDFGPALPPDAAKAMWEEFLRRFGPAAHGVFGADMRFISENQGPVTILIESPRV